MTGQIFHKFVPQKKSKQKREKLFERVIGTHSQAKKWTKNRQTKRRSIVNLKAELRHVKKNKTKS